MSGIRTSQRHRRGFIYVWVSLLVLALIGFVGLALDVGYRVLVGQQLQNAADAAALAAAVKVRRPPSVVHQVATTIAGYNTAAGESVQINPETDIVIGTVHPTTLEFTEGGRAPNAVRVRAPRVEGSAGGPVALAFGPIFGVESAGITRDAIAVARGTDDPALLVLHPTARCALDVRGSASLTVTGGPIQVNSRNSGCASCLGGNAAIHAPVTNVYGGACVSGGGTVDTLINTPMPPIPDPYAWLPMPPWSNPGFGNVTVTSGTSRTLTGGYYTGLTIRGTATLQPGIYLIGSGGLKINSEATMLADGVMFYLAEGGSIEFSAHPRIVLRAPDPARHSFFGVETYAGICIFQARNNNQTAKLSLAGSVELDGVFYFPNNKVEIASNGGDTAARIVASELSISGSGSGNIVINYTANEPKDGVDPYLVE